MAEAGKVCDDERAAVEIFGMSRLLLALVLVCLVRPSVSGQEEGPGPLDTEHNKPFI